MSTTPRTMADARHAGGSIPSARAASLVVLVALPFVLGSCAVTVMGKRIGMPARSPEARESSLQKDVRETREAAALAQAEPYWPFRLAELYAGVDSLKQAEAALDQSLARDPGFAPALALRSSLDYRAGRHDRAIRGIEAALARPGAFGGEPPRALLEGLALHYEALGDGDRARAILAASTGRRSASAPATIYLTMRGPAPEQADAMAEAAVRADPWSAANQNNYGITRLRAGDPLGARKAFERATELDSTLAGPFYNLAILEKYYLFHDDEAARWFDAYWRRSQEDPDGLAGVFGKSNRPSLARDED